MSRTKQIDVLKEIRRALRALRRAEAFIVAEERRADRERAKRMQREQDKRDLAQIDAARRDE